MTRIRPRTPAMSPARSEAFPRVGDTLCTVDWVSLTGSAPVARTRARFLAAVWSPTPRIAGVELTDHRPELQLGGLADQLQQRGRIFDAGDFDQDVVAALTGDRRLAHARPVDAVPEDVHRLVELVRGRPLRSGQDDAQ